MQLLLENLKGTSSAGILFGTALGKVTMYLEIFLVACLSFGLVQSRPGHIRLDDQDLQCKNCFGFGKRAKDNCLENAIVEPCIEDKPVCAQITSDIDETFELLCTSQTVFNDEKAYCEKHKTCVAVKL